MKKIISVMLAALAMLGAASAPAQAAKRLVTDSGAEIYGYLVPYGPDVNPGMYEFTPDGYKFFWADPVYNANYDYLLFNDGWYYDGRICGFALDGWNGDYWYLEVDFETGQLLRDRQKYLNTVNGWYILASFDEANEMIYGITTDDYNRIFWSKTDPSNPNSITNIVQLTEAERCYSLCYNPLEEVFYGITTQQQFVSINPEDGQQTVISTVPNASRFDSQFQTGLVYSPRDNAYIWNASMKDYSSAMYTISPQGEFSLWFNLDNEEEFTYLITTDKVSRDPDQPDKPAISGMDFANGALTGTVTLTMPARYLDGHELTGTLSWTLLVNGETYREGTAAAGATVPVEVTLPANDTYQFGAFVTLDGHTSFTANLKGYIGNDTPESPKNVDLTNTSISWEAVTEGVHNGYLDTSAITYNVFLNGKKLGTTTETTYSNLLPTTGSLQQYTATVTATCNGLSSTGAKSNMVVAGAAISLPIAMEPTEAQFNQLTIYDGNHDDVMWYFTTPETGYGGMVIDWSTTTPMDDYIFLPRAKFDDPEAFYSFSFDVSGRSHMYTERVSAVLATAPDNKSIVSTIIPATNIRKDDPMQPTMFQTLSGEFQVPEAGDYYVGIQCASRANLNGVVVKNFLLTNNNIVANSPGAPTDVVATAGANGALEVNVSFTMPTATYAGEALPAGTRLTATVTNDEFSTTVDGEAGQAVSATVKALQGDNTVSVVITDENGYNSVAVMKTVYCGVSIPANPENLKLTAAPDMMNAVLSWDPVTKPYVEGAYLNPADVTYSVYEFIRTDYGNYWGLYRQGLKSTSLNITLEEGSPMNEYAFAVMAENAAGSTGDYTYASAYMGTLYDLPFFDDFEELNYEDALATSPWLIYSGDWDFWWLYEISDNFGMDTTVMMAATGESGQLTSVVSMPRFTTKGMISGEIILDILQGEGTGDLTLYAEVYGQEDYVEIGQVSNSTGKQSINTVSLPLPDALMKQPWVNVYFQADLANAGEVVAISAIEVDGVSGVTNVEAGDVVIMGQHGDIRIVGAEGQPVSVYTLDGRVVYSGVAPSSDFTLRLAPSLYIVRAASKTAKLF